MTMIDRAFVRRSFAAGARTYDRSAGLQNDMNRRLVATHAGAAGRTARLLDIGMGTGNLSLQLARLLRGARVFGCDLAQPMLEIAVRKLTAEGIAARCAVADAERLPYRSHCFELVASGFTFQWLEDWSAALDEVRRVLTPGGLFLFSTFGAETLCELRDAYTAACAATGYDRGEALRLAVTPARVRQALVGCGFADISLETLRHRAVYPGVNDLVRAIKGMGARNASPRRNRTAGVRAVWKEMILHYERRWGDAAGIPATFEIIMGAARTP